jgi:predicted CXXCH cytochrome family protein
MKRTYIFLALLLTASVIGAVLTTSPTGVVAGDGGVVFSHAIHKDLAECSACHNAADSEAAGDNLMPTPESCIGCHEDADVRGYWSLSEDDDLTAQVLQVKDRRLIFSHKQHAEMEQSCGVCHGGIVANEDSAYPSMDICSRCHNDADATALIKRGSEDIAKVIPASNRCESCHTTLAGLYPQNHMTADFISNHGKFAMNGEASRDCASCHSQSFCQECHTPSNSVPSGIAADRFYNPASPRGEKMDRPDVLTVQKAHPLTYRYTHGFDARAKSSRCETCHEPESFCQPCHQNGHDATGMRIVPQSHQLAGFVALGGGSAMNRHGKLAKMDMESCATCHNLDGGDPICAACHNTGVVTGGMR